MNILKINFIFVLMLLLASCATPYQPYGFDGWGWGGGGYSDVQLNDDTYKVSFKANNATSRDAVQNLLLRRCAELTKSRGYNYFVILSANEDRQDSQYTTPTRVTANTARYGSGSFYGNSNYYGNTGSFNGYYNEDSSSNTDITVHPGQTYNFSKYLDTVVIKMLRNNKKAPMALKADSILANYNVTTKK